ncbi:MAG TPA: phosphoribosylformylglycinamidine synthase subunit PurS [Mycobacteriales bacterium]|nr:phosphoribosylformylglycinamidine synthase subunit PurS [Mycobacteriales bacterium]
MARVVVDVTLKPEILDPQGQAVANALPSLGVTGVQSVRVGKHFEIEIDGDIDDARLAAVHTMAQQLLANPVIEDFTVTVDA